MFEKLFGRFFKKKGGKVAKKKASAPSGEAVNEPVGAEKSALSGSSGQSAPSGSVGLGPLLRPLHSTGQ